MSKTDYDLSKIKAFIFDVDGVLSPSKLFIETIGEPRRMMNVKDSYAIQYACKLGYTIVVLTGAKSNILKTKYQQLGVEYVFTEARDKREVYKNWVAKMKLQPEEIAYMGDDIPDYEVMKLVGFPCCPTDASIDIQRIARYISPYIGGEGCVRDVIEQTLRAQGKWFDTNHAYYW